MPDTFQIYQSELTGPELDEALKNIALVQQSVADAAQSAAAAGESAADAAQAAQTAETYGAIVQQNQPAIQDIADNLAAVQGAAQNAQTAQSAATEAAASAQEAEQWAEQAQQIAQGAMGWYADPQALQSAHPTGQAGNWAIVGSTDTIWVWDTDTNAWLDTSQNVNLSDYYTKAQADARFSDAVAYTITVPTTGWTTGSLTWGGTTYTRKCTVTAADATASPTSVTMAYEGGDYDAYCQIGLIDTQAGSVVLWATADPTAECQIRVVEVRNGEKS